MLDKLQNQGWSVKQHDNGVTTISACFDEGFFTNVDIWPMDAFKGSFRNAKTLLEQVEKGNAAFVVTSITVHRLTHPYNDHVITGQTSDFNEAVRFAYDACQEWAARFDGFCED